MQYKNNNNFSKNQVSQYHLPFQPNRKYFVAIPNLILDHPELDIYDQMLYIHIKRIAGDNGQCWASIRYLAKKMKVSNDRVIKSLQKLLKLGLIKHAGTKKVKTRPRNVYEIVDIWEMNLNYYSNHQNNNTEMIENQEEVIHTPNDKVCSSGEQSQKVCSCSEQTPTAKPKNQLKINNLNEKTLNLRKTILKKKNKNHHHPEKTMTMLITQSNPNPLKKK
jgi:DNA-binding Lrp family transcriptional regulator